VLKPAFQRRGKLDIACLCEGAGVKVQFDALELERQLEKAGIADRVNVWISTYQTRSEADRENAFRTDPQALALFPKLAKKKPVKPFLRITNANPWSEKLRLIKRQGVYEPGKVPETIVFLFGHHVGDSRREEAMRDFGIRKQTLKTPFNENASDFHRREYYRLAAEKIRALTETPTAWKQEKNRGCYY